MYIKTIPVGVFQCNCTIVACEATGKAIVVDPGDEAEKILEIVQAHGIEVTSVIHTHAHLDHIMGAFGVVEATGAPARLHREDKLLWQRVDEVAASYFIPTPNTPPLGADLEDGEVIRFGNAEARVIHTPGHTTGSCCLALDTEDGGHVLLSGDTLFRGKVGIVSSYPDKRRNFERIIASICNRLLTFDDETRVVPGHGPETRIGVERSNPLFATRNGVAFPV